MEIDKLLRIHKRSSDKDVLSLIVGNRVTHYSGQDGVSIVRKDFELLVDDILKFIEYRNKL